MGDCQHDAHDGCDHGAAPSAPGVVAGTGHGLDCVRIANAHGEALVYLQGAHVASWRPAGAAEVLWMSASSLFAPGKPIRGGVPICWPWFGPHAERADLPAHGFARLRAWTWAGAQVLSDGATRVAFELRDDEATRVQWPHAFHLRYTVTVGARLELRLAVLNSGDREFACDEALHTYFTVGDIREAAIAGLRDAEYVDKMRGGERFREERDQVRFDAETDRVYASQAECVLHDPLLGRRIVVGKHGSASTVVWNPWDAKAARMADFGDQEWPGMVCIETANVLDARLRLAPGRGHELAQVLSVGG